MSKKWFKSGPQMSQIVVFLSFPLNQCRINVGAERYFTSEKFHEKNLESLNKIWAIWLSMNVETQSSPVSPIGHENSVVTSQNHFYIGCLRAKVAKNFHLKIKVSFEMIFMLKYNSHHLLIRSTEWCGHAQTSRFLSNRFPQFLIIIWPCDFR